MYSLCVKFEPSAKDQEGLQVQFYDVSPESKSFDIPAKVSRYPNTIDTWQSWSGVLSTFNPIYEMVHSVASTLLEK
jgi:hypothetical protein